MHTKSRWNHAHAIRNGINAPPMKPMFDPYRSLTCGFVEIILSRNTHKWNSQIT